MESSNNCSNPGLIINVVLSFVPLRGGKKQLSSEIVSKRVSFCCVANVQHLVKKVVDFLVFGSQGVRVHFSRHNSTNPRALTNRSGIN